MAEMVTGSCLCGGVRFEVTLPFSDANYCHCSRCRKHSGAEAAVTARVRREQFELLSGQELIRVYEPDDGAVKAFCSVCGSSLFGRRWPEGDEIAIRLGTIDGDPRSARSCTRSSARSRHGASSPTTGCRATRRATGRRSGDQLRVGAHPGRLGCRRRGAPREKGRQLAELPGSLIAFCVPDWPRACERRAVASS